MKADMQANIRTLLTNCILRTHLFGGTVANVDPVEDAMQLLLMIDRETANELLGEANEND